MVCAIRPEWQESSILLRVYFFSDSLRGRIVGRYSSGQRGLTVNQVASPSQVRILACPPHHSCWAGDSERWWARPGHLIQGVLERQGVMPLRHGTSGRSSGVELQPSKLAVASSNLVARSKLNLFDPERFECARRDKATTASRAHVAQLAEHVLGKDEVTRSIRVVGSIITPAHPGPAGTGLLPVGLLGSGVPIAPKLQWVRRSHVPGETRPPVED